MENEMGAGKHCIITPLIVVFILATTAPAAQRQKVMRKQH
jgi:hypothetical protein